MIDGQFAVAFAAGMLSVVNPCGFAMLPAYLGFFLGVEGGGDDARASLSKALAVGLCVSAGFALTFGVIGLVISHLTNDVYEWGPWVSVAIGFVLVLLGLYLLSGRELKVPEATVRQRAERLINRGVVQIVGVTDPLAMGFQQPALIGLKVEPAAQPSYVYVTKVAVPAPDPTPQNMIDESHRPVLARASLPLPTPIGTLGAIHLATAMLWRESSSADLVFAICHMIGIRAHEPAGQVAAAGSAAA